MAGPPLGRRPRAARRAERRGGAHARARGGTGRRSPGARGQGRSGPRRAGGVASQPRLAAAEVPGPLTGPPGRGARPRDRMCRSPPPGRARRRAGGSARQGDSRAPLCAPPGTGAPGHRSPQPAVETARTPAARDPAGGGSCWTRWGWAIGPQALPRTCGAHRRRRLPRRPLRPRRRTRPRAGPTRRRRPPPPSRRHRPPRRATAIRSSPRPAPPTRWCSTWAGPTPITSPFRPASASDAALHGPADVDRGGRSPRRPSLLGRAVGRLEPLGAERDRALRPLPRRRRDPLLRALSRLASRHAVAHHQLHRRGRLAGSWGPYAELVARGLGRVARPERPAPRMRRRRRVQQHRSGAVRGLGRHALPVLLHHPALPRPAGAGRVCEPGRAISVLEWPRSAHRRGPAPAAVRG